MGKNLKHELRDVVMRSFVPGRDKHSDQRNNNTTGVIYSHTAKRDTLDVVNQFADWIKTNRPDIKKLHQITPEVVKAYLDGKAAAGCTQKTLDTYRDRLAKLGECINARRGLDVRMAVDRVQTVTPKAADRGAAAAISRGEYNMIITYALEHPSGSAYAVLLEQHLGGRVTDVCERMTIDRDRVKMTCKGGKILYRDITPELAALLRNPDFSPYRFIDSTGRPAFALPKAGSINKYLARVEDRLGLPRHSFHDIRRLLAQERYDELRQAGVSRSDALSQIGVWLNHGSKRQQLVLKSYVANPW